MLIIGKLVVFLDEQVEEILRGTKLEGLLLHLMLSYQLERARGGGRVFRPDF